jgi:hypothetical protein
MAQGGARTTLDIDAVCSRGTIHTAHAPRALFFAG